MVEVAEAWGGMASLVDLDAQVRVKLTTRREGCRRVTVRVQGCGGLDIRRAYLRPLRAIHTKAGALA